MPVPRRDTDGADLHAELARSGIADRHDVVVVEVPDVIERFAALDLRVTSMGRPAEADPILFRCAAAAGVASVSSAGTGVT